MKNRLIAALIAVASSLSLAAPLVISSGCAGEVEYRDEHGHPYAHRHYHDEEVYQHEDGKWYAHRHEGWVAVEVKA